MSKRIKEVSPSGGEHDDEIVQQAVSALGGKEHEKKRKPPENITLANAQLPKCMGKVIKEYPRYAPCPVHSNAVGTMTTWLPQKGLDPSMREFDCPYQHAFYTRVHGIVETKPRKKRIKGSARESWG